MLLLSRLLQGALGGVVEAAAGFVGASGPDGERGKALGKSFSATAAGALTGPLVGGALLGVSGLRPFMVAVVVAAGLLAAACTWGLREAPHEARTADRPAPSASRADGRRRLPGLVPLAAAATLVYLAVYGLIPVYAEHVAGVVRQPGSAGLWVGGLHSVMWAATLLGSVWWGNRNDRTGRPLGSFVAAAALCSVSIASLALPLVPPAMVPARIVQGFCFAALAQSLFLHVSRTTARSGQSGRIGMINSFLLVGQGVGPLLAGPFTVWLTAAEAILLLSGAGVLAALLAAPPSRREVKDQAELRHAAPLAHGAGTDETPEVRPERGSHAA